MLPVVSDMEKGLVHVAVKTRPCATMHSNNSFDGLEVFEGTNDVGAMLSSDSSNLVVAPKLKCD